MTSMMSYLKCFKFCELGIANCVRVHGVFPSFGNSVPPRLIANYFPHSHKNSTDIKQDTCTYSYKLILNYFMRQMKLSAVLKAYSTAFDLLGKVACQIL